ncbi:membrane protein [Lysobacter arseniciresistens ZS79]|uniref:Membrane protein n=1 Tax=Lysobacter arseniciresistens ZS79 TaxID=913325 RepID=A0A0A0F500_9GAMM|nr:membrane protein [Lysobacter arseniciresistens ZS79]
MLALAIVVLVLLWDWNWFKGPIERQVEARTGREFEIGGDLDVDLGWVPVITADGLAFGNADWAGTPVMASARRLELALAIKPLFRGEVLIPDIRLSAPRLNLETGEHGGNWNFGEPGSDTDVEFRRVWIDDGKLAFVDAANDTDIKVDVATAKAEDGATDGDGRAPPIVVEGGGRWQGNAFSLEGEAESPLELQNPDSPYRIDARARAGDTRAHARGTLLDPLRLRDFDLQLALGGSNLADLYPLLGIALPDTPPYRLDGHFTRDGTTWFYNDFNGTVGDSDLGGDANVDTGGPRPYLRADLHSSRLDFDDLAGFVGGAPDTGGSESTNPELAAKAAQEQASGRVLPDTPYQLDKLQAMDADVRLRAARINSPSLPLDDMDAHLYLENGLLRLDPLNFGVAGGDIRSTIRMDARESPIRTRADVNASGLDLSSLLPKVELAQNAIGRVGGHVQLAGTGNSVAAMLGSSNGEVAVGMGSGRISNLLMEMAGIDLAEIIKFKLTEDRLIPVRCAFGDFKVDDGLMTVRSLAFDTTDTILIGEGTISLKDERLDLVIKPRPKDRSLFAFRAPLLVDGSFANPDLRPDMGRIGLRAAIALTLGNIAPPAALLATLELGPGEDASCGGRYAK